MQCGLDGASVIESLDVRLRLGVETLAIVTLDTSGATSGGHMVDPGAHCGCTGITTR